MSLQSAPFFWVTCDEPECAARCPDDRHEFMAWSDTDQAEDCALDSEWLGRDGKHYCEIHRIAFDLDDDEYPHPPSTQSKVTA
ncbi:MAG TPA: hypothetical protein VIJ31_10560 [Acidothermaceae bacterium]